MWSSCRYSLPSVMLYRRERLNKMANATEEKNVDLVLEVGNIYQCSNPKDEFQATLRREILAIKGDCVFYIYWSTQIPKVKVYDWATVEEFVERTVKCEDNI